MIQYKLQYINSILDSPDNILGIIYKITNNKTNKSYIGQTLTHKLNAKRYRPFGEVRRLNQHLSDALCNSKKNQCTCLNNSIRKHGKECFTTEVIEYCEPENSNEREIYWIKQYNTISPNGYNLSEGGLKGPTLQEQRVKLMEKTREQFLKKKLDRYTGIVTKIDINHMDQYIRERHHDRYGGVYYTVIIDGIKSIFVGQHISKEDLKQQVYTFLTTLEKLQHDQTAGTP